jgi:hypothetical protein
MSETAMRDHYAILDPAREAIDQRNSRHSEVGVQWKMVASH